MIPVLLILEISLVPWSDSLAGGPAPSPGPDVSAVASSVAETASSAALLKRRAAELTAALQDYRESLERLLVIHEQALARAAEKRRTWQALHERGTISRRELEQADAAVATLQGKVDRTMHEIAAADHAIAEAAAMETLAALPSPALPPTAGDEQRQAPTFPWHEGGGIWSLPSVASKLEQMFMARFGRVLPISAFGQTPMHDRMGFDHHNALDLAVHPDSREGQALLEYLRTEGIPFIAFRGAVPGAASGAHIHVGQPSPRITVVTHSDPRHP